MARVIYFCPSFLKRLVSSLSKLRTGDTLGKMASYSDFTKIA